MTLGIQLLNNGGGTAVSENYRNPLLAVKSTVTTVSASPWLAGSKFSITFTRSAVTDAVICAIAPSDYAMLTGCSFSGLDCTWSFMTNLAVGSTVTYYIFSNAVAVPTDDYGIEVYDASGQKLFNSACKPLRIAHLGSHTVTALGTTDHTYVSGRTYAVALYRYSEMGRYIAMSGDTERFGGGVKQITDGIGCGQVYYTTEAGDTSGLSWNPMPFIAIDVTNY